jgi:hypothetical protein
LSFVSDNSNCYFARDVQFPYQCCSGDLFLLGCDALLLEWYFFTPQAFNVKTLLFESSDNTNPQTDRYMPGLLRLSTVQTQKKHAIYKSAWTPLMLLQNSPLLTVVYRCNISIALSGLTRGMVADTWRKTSYPPPPPKEFVNILGNAQPEETCLKQPVSQNMEPQLH